MSDITYLIWSQKHSAWWKPGGFGYTGDIDQAGRFSEADAVPIVVRSAQCGVREQVSLMVAAPDNWAEPAAEVEAPVRGPLVEVLTDWFTRKSGAPR